MNIPFEPIPSSPYQYTPEVIAQAEQLTGKPFPEDFKSYLLNTGWRKIAYNHRSILIPNGEYIYTLQFEGVQHQAFALNSYKNNGYYPFGKLSGEINPQINYQLLIDLNTGSIWASDSLKIADSFTAFLVQIGNNDQLKAVANKNNEALFLKLLSQVQQDTPPTATDTPEQLFKILFEEQQQPVIVNGIRNVEFQHYDNSLRMENEQKFTERVNAFANHMHIPSLQRKNIKISAPTPLERNYYLFTADSIVGDNHLLQETFLLHHDEKWTLLSRRTATIEEVKIKGVGTFTYDDTSNWELTKKVTPPWSELAANIIIYGEEDALTASKINFVKEILNKTDFKPALEAYILNDYKEFGDGEVENENDIWSALGKSIYIYIYSDNEFHISANCLWDNEHGITIKVKDWQIL